MRSSQTLTPVVPETHAYPSWQKGNSGSGCDAQGSPRFAQATQRGGLPRHRRIPHSWSEMHGAPRSGQGRQTGEEGPATWQLKPGEQKVSPVTTAHNPPSPMNSLQTNPPSADHSNVPEAQASGVVTPAPLPLWD
jgi:hypothetical protein